MKPFAFILPLALLAVSTVFAAEDAPADVPAASYPELPELDDLIAVQAATAAAFPDIKDPGNPAQIAKSEPRPIVMELPLAGDPVVLARTSASPDVAAPKEIGDPAGLGESVKPPTIDPVKEAGDPVSLAATATPPAITDLAKPTVPDLFTINQLFNWGKPHGQWMNQMVKDIEAAKKAGDMETYKSLTARYAAWADKYLRLENPPELDGNPGR